MLIRPFVSWRGSDAWLGTEDSNLDLLIQSQLSYP